MTECKPSKLNAGGKGKKLLVISIPGLSRAQVLEQAPRLKALGEAGSSGVLQPVFPAVTATAQTSMITGQTPAKHGIVGNGWYFRELNEVWLWRQSERLARGEAVWDTVKKTNPQFKCLKHFWWFGMASTADIHVNVRPAYLADGRKLPDIYSNKEYLAKELQEKFGPFPLFNFWGPATNINSSKWIADTAAYLLEQENPNLALVYLPHLDYSQQKYGPKHPEVEKDIRDIDAVASTLVEKAKSMGYEILVVSEYQIEPVNLPIHINRVLRREGWLKVVRNASGELIDFASSEAFAVADHQAAHVYLKNPAKKDEVRKRLQFVEGISSVMDEREKTLAGINHPNAGDLVAVATPGAWFSYYYWLNDTEAPDFARTVAIHSKPGYDPCELFIDPKIPAPKLKIAWTLLKKTLGFRYVMNLIPLDAGLVRGSHGLPPAGGDDAPVILCASPGLFLRDQKLPMTEVRDLMLKLSI